MNLLLSCLLKTTTISFRSGVWPYLKGCCNHAMLRCQKGANPRRSVTDRSAGKKIEKDSFLCSLTRNLAIIPSPTTRLLDRQKACPKKEKHWHQTAARTETLCNIYINIRVLYNLNDSNMAAAPQSCQGLYGYGG